MALLNREPMTEYKKEVTMKKLFIPLAVLMFAMSPAVHCTTAIQKPFFDFFRKLIEPPKRRVPIQRAPIRPKQEKKIVIPPLQMNIMGISGEVGNRVAIVSYKGSQRLLMEGDEQPGEYKVISIDEQKITLLHIQAGRRQEVTF
jgi:hypothetical protein